MTEMRCQARTSGFSCLGLLVEPSVVWSLLPLLQPITVQPAVFLWVLKPTCWFFPPARKNSWLNVYQRVILTYINSINSAGSTFFHCKKLTASSPNGAQYCLKWLCCLYRHVYGYKGNFLGNVLIVKKGKERKGGKV